jgi:hypothetical protein
MRYAFSAFILIVLAHQALDTAATGTDAARPGQISLDPPTLECLGLRWLIAGDSDGDAGVAVSFRRAQDSEWRRSTPLRRVDLMAMEEGRPPEGETLFAGSLLFLEPDTEYIIRLELSDPDGGSETKEVHQRTWAEPILPQPKRVFHVVPGSGGGAGAERNPFQGLTAATALAQPGDCFLLHAGRYTEKFVIKQSGTAAAPIVWRAAGDGDAIIDAGANSAAISGYDKAYQVFEGIHIIGSRYGFHLSGSRWITIRRCELREVGTGIFGDAGEERFFIADNLIIGRQPYPLPKGYKAAGEYRGIELSGNGSVICHNTVRGFRDGIDVREQGPVFAMDICYNDIGEMSDDGIELDGSSWNTRAYGNRITNVTDGISFQPIKGGPVFVVRNVLYHIKHETFKLHLSPTNKDAPDWRVGPHRTSGGVILHNTVVKDGPPLRVWSDEGPVHGFLFRNNLLVGTGNQAIDISCPMNDCDLDHNVYVAAEGGFTKFAGWNRKTYPGLTEFARDAGQEKSGLVVTTMDGVFAAAMAIPTEAIAYPAPDLHPAKESPVIDRGEQLPGINDAYVGKAPDVGAYEFNGVAPVYGVRDLAKP